MTLSTITKHLQTIGCVFPDIALLQPADPFLDTTGEDLRRRIFITQENSGALLCLRPEFTVPVCVAHLRNGNGSARYGYGGSVFRQRDDDSSEFVQAGFEDFGEADKNAADINCVKTALDVLQAVGASSSMLVLGNQSIFLDLLQALDVPAAWRKKLIRSFGDPTRLAETLALISSNEEDQVELPSKILSALKSSDGAQLTEELQRLMREDGLPLSAGRTPSAIAERLMEQHQLQSIRLGEEKREVLETYLKLEGPLERAAEALADFAERSGIDLASGVSTLEALIEGVSDLSPDARFKANFGRRLDYYTGLVFEIYRDGLEKPLIGGGRYDRLLTLLGAEKEIPAVGFAIWVDRLEVNA